MHMALCCHSSSPSKVSRFSLTTSSAGSPSVAEYNQRQCIGGGGGVRLEFARVVAAQRQVVSGLKYYLGVATAEEAEGAGNAGERMFDAIVVAKPWLESRTLLRFKPADAM